MKESNFILKVFTSVLIFGIMECISSPVFGMEPQKQEQETAQSIWKEFRRRLGESYCSGNVEILKTLKNDYDVTGSADSHDGVWEIKAFCSEKIKWDCLIKDVAEQNKVWDRFGKYWIHNSEICPNFAFYYIGNNNKLEDAILYGKQKRRGAEREQAAYQKKIELRDSWIQRSFQYWKELKEPGSPFTYGKLYNLLKDMAIYHNDFEKQYSSLETGIRYHPEYLTYDEILLMVKDLEKGVGYLKISSPHILK